MQTTSDVSTSSSVSIPRSSFSAPRSCFDLVVGSLSQDFPSQNPGQLYNMVKIAAEAESEPSQESINNLDKGSHRWDSHEDLG